VQAQPLTKERPRNLRGSYTNRANFSPNKTLRFNVKLVLGVEDWWETGRGIGLCLIVFPPGTLSKDRDRATVLGTAAVN